jgi:hypothetical protein
MSVKLEYSMQIKSTLLEKKVWETFVKLISNGGVGMRKIRVTHRM